MQTLVIPLIPSLPAILRTDASGASWVITVTLLAAAVIMPVSGRLGDLYGKRRVLLVSVAVLVAGSVVAALASSLVPMVVGRGLQGCAMGVIPLGISIMRDILPAERVGTAIATMSATLGVGGAIGLPLSAVVAESSSWRVLFWLSAALAAVCLTLLWTVVPGSSVRASGRFDVLGALGLGAGLVCLLLAITKGGTWGWGSATTLGLFAAAVVVLAVWGVHQLRVRHPLVDLRVSARRPVLFTNLASVLVGFSMYSMSLVLPQLLQAPAATGYGLGQSMAAAGLWMAPGGLVMMALSPVSARITRRHGPRTSLVVGTSIIAIGYLLSTLLLHSAFEIMVAGIVVSSGVGIAYAAMPGLIMGSVPLRETASANGLNSLARSVGTSVSSAVVATLLAHMTVTVGSLTVPSLTGFRVAFLIAAGAAAVGVLVTLLVPRVRDGSGDGLDDVTAAPVAEDRRELQV
ncbi:MFS transporter [Actinophytocola sp. NPDC049390]|uniref:MFS transporter n=1 Tax=Actinophytocola sp. NPDC049390 TaxID=3363894 RepID=UPI0037A23730